MRADRLLSLLMLLQARGRMTAAALARELEVSERTIYRDIDALGSAGVPVYGDPGPEGGYALLDSYRTSLTGLNEGEARALFMLNLALLRVPTPLQDLGLSQELKTALLKLSAALPGQRGEQEQVRQRIYLDLSGPPGDETPAPPHLKTIHQAIWSDCRLWLAYRSLPGVLLERLVDPYGLVARAGAWYLVCAREGCLRIHRVADLLEARLAEGKFQRPPGFDLAAFWEEWCAGQQEVRSGYTVQVRVTPGFIPSLPYYFGSEIRQRIEADGPPDSEGRFRLELTFESLEAARDRLLDFGRGVEVLAPLALRLSLLDHAEQLIKLYQGGIDG